MGHRTIFLSHRFIFYKVHILIAQGKLFYPGWTPILSLGYVWIKMDYTHAELTEILKSKINALNEPPLITK